jgi:hypothetical protein
MDTRGSFVRLRLVQERPDIPGVQLLSNDGGHGHFAADGQRQAHHGVELRGLVLRPQSTGTGHFLELHSGRFLENGQKALDQPGFKIWCHVFISCSANLGIYCILAVQQI